MEKCSREFFIGRKRLQKAGAYVIIKSPHNLIWNFFQSKRNNYGIVVSVSILFVWKEI